MVPSLSEVALCKDCKIVVMELFEMDCRSICASKLLFRCSVCFMDAGQNSKSSLNFIQSIEHRSHFVSLTINGSRVAKCPRVQSEFAGEETRRGKLSLANRKVGNWLLIWDVFRSQTVIAVTPSKRSSVA